MLKTDVTPQKLNETYQRDYYWYLKSPAFRTMFLERIGGLVNGYGDPVLDVGCGEGWLADYVTVPYVGVDGSEEAIATARQRVKRPAEQFCVARFEDRRDIDILSGRGQFPTIVFGGMLDVYVKPQERVTLLEQYLRFGTKRFVIYDLERLDHRPLAKRFRLVHEWHGTAIVPQIKMVKRKRKILVYEVDP